MYYHCKKHNFWEKTDQSSSLLNGAVFIQISKYLKTTVYSTSIVLMMKLKFITFCHQYIYPPSYVVHKCRFEKFS